MAAAAGVLSPRSAMKGVLEDPTGIANGGSPSQTVRKQGFLFGRIPVSDISQRGSRSVPADKQLGIALAEALRRRMFETPEQGSAPSSSLQARQVTELRLDEPEAAAASASAEMEVDPAPALEESAKRTGISSAEIWGRPNEDKADKMPKGLAEEDGDLWLHSWTMRHTGPRDREEHEAWLKAEEIRKKDAAQELLAWLKTHE